MIDADYIRVQARAAVDPFFLRLREELYGSGVSFGRIQASRLPTNVIYTSNLDSNAQNQGFIKGVTTLQNGNQVATEQRELNFVNAVVSSTGAQTTITIPSGFVDPMTTYGDMIVRGTSGPVRLPVGSSGNVLTVVNGYPQWQPGLFDPTTAQGDIIYRDSGLVRLPIGSAGNLLTVSNGVPAWRSMLDHNELNAIQGGNATERFHLDANQYAAISGASSIPNERVVYSNGSQLVGSTAFRFINATPRLYIGNIYIGQQESGSNTVVAYSGGTTYAVRVSSSDTYINAPSAGSVFIQSNENNRIQITNTETNFYSSTVYLRNCALEVRDNAPSTVVRLATNGDVECRRINYNGTGDFDIQYAGETRIKLGAVTYFLNKEVHLSNTSIRIFDSSSNQNILVDKDGTVYCKKINSLGTGNFDIQHNYQTRIQLISGAIRFLNAPVYLADTSLSIFSGSNNNINLHPDGTLNAKFGNFWGNSYNSHFHWGANQDIYIRCGTSNGAVYINDAETLNRVQIGRPLTGTIQGKLSVASNELLGTSTGNQASIMTIGSQMISGNSIKFHIASYRNSNGTDWTTASMLLRPAVDNTNFGPFLSFRPINGCLGINFADPTYALQLLNNADNSGRGMANAWLTYSSKTKKTNIREIPIEESIKIVENLKASRFTWKDNGVEDFGLIAEDVKEIIPEIVSGNSPDEYGIEYGRIAVLLIPALRHLLNYTQKLEQRILDLEKKLSDICK